MAMTALVTLVTPGMERKEGRKGEQKQWNDKAITRTASAVKHIAMRSLPLPGLECGYSIPVIHRHLLSQNTGHSKIAVIHLQRPLKGFCSGVTGLDGRCVFARK